MIVIKPSIDVTMIKVDLQPLHSESRFYLTQ